MSLRPGELKRTPFKRTMPTEGKVRLRKCAIKTCRQPFQPRSMTHKCCSPDCAAEHVKLEREKKDRQERQKGLQALKTKRDYIKEAQIWFNKAVRARDKKAGYPCISSGRPLDWSGNAVDCGHYRSVGSAPHLRFNFDNAHAQSKIDNQWLGGNIVLYRKNLIDRIGLQRVEALEADQSIAKWSNEELQAMIAEFKRLYKEFSSV